MMNVRRLVATGLAATSLGGAVGGTALVVHAATPPLRQQTVHRAKPCPTPSPGTLPTRQCTPKPKPKPKPKHFGLKGTHSPRPTPRSRTTHTPTASPRPRTTHTPAASPPAP
jgi:hypothetical protein